MKKSQCFAPGWALASCAAPILDSGNVHTLDGRCGRCECCVLLAGELRRTQDCTERYERGGGTIRVHFVARHSSLEVIQVILCFWTTDVHQTSDGGTETLAASRSIANGLNRMAIQARHCPSQDWALRSRF